MFRKQLIAATRFCAFILLLSFLGLSAAWAQDTNGEQSPDNTQPPSNTPPPAFGQEPTAAPPVSEFPPLSGLDEPSLEPNVSTRSYLQPGFEVSESADSNINNSLQGGNASFASVTRVLGSAELQRLWNRYQLTMDYLGGGAFYSGSFRSNDQMHELALNSRMLWRTGALQFRDTASYLPEGVFGGMAFGGIGGLGLTGLGGLGIGAGNRFDFFGPGQVGNLGVTPRVNNLAILDMQQSLSPRSSFTLAGGYNLVHFTQSTGGLLLDSRQATAQAGYDHILNRRNQVGLSYGFQEFHFPTLGGGTFTTHVLQALYGHQISGRMDLLLSAGPQFADINLPVGGRTVKVSGSGRASLRYRYPKTALSVSYDHFESAGAGFYAGATMDIIRLAASRPVGRLWDITGDIGYARNKRLQQLVTGIPGNTEQNGFAAFRVSRILSRSWRGFAFYQFGDLAFDSAFCGTVTNCNHTSMLHIAGVGITWQPRALRLD